MVSHGYNWQNKTKTNIAIFAEQSCRNKERDRGILRVTSKFRELAPAREDDESNLRIAEHRELVSFLEQTIPSLGECYLAVDFVLYSLQHHFSSPHFVGTKLIIPPPNKIKILQIVKDQRYSSFLILWLFCFLVDNNEEWLWWVMRECNMSFRKTLLYIIVLYCLFLKGNLENYGVFFLSILPKMELLYNFGKITNLVTGIYTDVYFDYLPLTSYN